LRCEKGAALHFDDKTWPEKGEPEPDTATSKSPSSPPRSSFFLPGDEVRD